MPCNQQQLITRDQPHDLRVPSTQSGAAVMVSDGVRDIDAGKSLAQATQAEIDVFEVRSVALIESVELIENIAAKDACGARRDRDG